MLLGTVYAGGQTNVGILHGNISKEKGRERKEEGIV